MNGRADTDGVPTALAHLLARPPQSVRPLGEQRFEVGLDDQSQQGAAHRLVQVIDPAAAARAGEEDPRPDSLLVPRHLSVDEAAFAEGLMDASDGLWFQPANDPRWLGLVHGRHPWLLYGGLLTVEPVLVQRPLSAVLLELAPQDGFAAPVLGLPSPSPARSGVGDDVARAQRQARVAMKQRDDAVKALAAFRGSVRYRVGDALVRSRTRPTAALELVGGVLKRRVRARAGLPARRRTGTGHPVPAPAADPTDAADRTVLTRRTVLEVARVQHGAVLLLGDRHLLPTVAEGPAVVPILPGALGPTPAQVASASLLVVDAGAHTAPGPWLGVGTAPAVRLTRDLRTTLAEAERAGVPTVLLVGDGAPPSPLAELAFDHQVRVGEREGSWSPGVDLDALPSPDGPEHGTVVDVDADLAVGWRGRPGGLVGRLVGVGEVVTSDPVVALTAACLGAAVRPGPTDPGLLEALARDLPPVPVPSSDPEQRRQAAAALREALTDRPGPRARLLELYRRSGALAPYALRHGGPTTVVVLGDGSALAAPRLPEGLGHGPVRLVLIGGTSAEADPSWWHVMAQAPSEVSARAVAAVAGHGDVLLCALPAEPALREVLDRPARPAAGPLAVAGGVLVPTAFLASMSVSVSDALSLLGGPRA